MQPKFTNSQLASASRRTPKKQQTFTPNLTSFLEAYVTLKFLKRKPSDSVDRVVHSIASGLVSGVTNGKIMTAKQLLLALGLHNITGTHKVVDIVSKLGHCINYKNTCEMETAQTVKAKALSEGIISITISSNRTIIICFNCILGQ